MPAPSTLSMPRGMWGALPYGSQWRPQYYRKNVGAYNTICVREVAEYCFCRCTGYSPWYRGLTLCTLLCFLRSFPGPFRAGVPGRLVLVGSGCTSWRRAVSRVFAYPGRRRGVGAESSALAKPSGRRSKRALRSERWAGVRKRALLLGQTFRSVIGLPFWPII